MSDTHINQAMIEDVKAFAHKHGQSIVIILSLRDDMMESRVTSYGKSPYQKVMAARLGDEYFKHHPKLEGGVDFRPQAGGVRGIDLVAAHLRMMEEQGAFENELKDFDLPEGVDDHEQMEAMLNLAAMYTKQVDRLQQRIDAQEKGGGS